MTSHFGCRQAARSEAAPARLHRVLLCCVVSVACSVASMPSVSAQGAEAGAAPGQGSEREQRGEEEERSERAEGGGPAGTGAQAGPPEGKGSRSSSVESRFPGVETPVQPTDMILRPGGMPLDAPEELDLGRDAREQAILRRQQRQNRFNPAFGLVFEPVFAYAERRQMFNDGTGKNSRLGNGAGEKDADVGSKVPANFSASLRTIELFAAADVDPFARAYLIAAGHAEALNSIDDSGGETFQKAVFEIEEAAIQTTSLPYNLSVRGGRFFADWGFLGKRHGHDLPQIDRPPSIAQLYDQTRTDGLEVSWLAPTPFFLQLTAGWGFNFGAEGEDPLTQFRQQVNQGNTLFGSARTYYDLDDDNNLELGFSVTYSPQARILEPDELALMPEASEGDRIDRHTLDWDFHYRWYPLGRGLRQSLSLHGEVFYDFGQGRRDVFGTTVSQGAWGGYAYAEYRLSKRWRPGFRFDYYQLPSEPELFDGGGSTVNASGTRTDVRTYSPYVTFYPSEFQRFILQYNRSDHGNASDNSQFLFQWEVVIGSHQHGFTERD